VIADAKEYSFDGFSVERMKSLSFSLKMRICCTKHQKNYRLYCMLYSIKAKALKLFARYLDNGE
jgi:hypothetical protein